MQVHAQALHHFVHRVGVSVVEGCGGKQARTQLIEEAVVGIQRHDPVNEKATLRTRAHEAHIALEYVPKLGKFIKMVLSQEFSHVGQALVIFHAKHRPVGLGHDCHRAELVEDERLATEAYALLLENGRPFVFALDEQGDRVLINLASDEYYKSVKESQLEAQIVKPVFLDNKNGKYKVVSFYAKKARGLMCRFIIQNRLERVEQLKEFDLGGYWFDATSSAEKEFVFKRDINE